MADAPMPPRGIRTPDQRLRVFISSTLGELADERTAVARAVTALGLTPVMFELGARPHPPRELYRAYLEQSDIFVGLYWQRYGWVAPDMDISGLEDEYQLSRSMLPRLLYMKAPAPDREERLTEMLAGIDSESYRSFRTPRELGHLVREDIAVLLSERFAASAAPPAAERPRPVARRSLPVAGTSLIGRDQDVDAVATLLAEPSTRLVTLTGPGGIGKTRLAVAVAERVAEEFPAGTTFVPLASMTEPHLALTRIAGEVGASVEASQSPLDALAEHLADARSLLVLDNLEQVVDIAPDLDELLTRCPGVAILATSRTVLRLRAEREYPVPALAAQAAVDLFVDRAQAVRPDFQLAGGNVDAVAEIGRRLDGMPLAIELAAARSRLLTPEALLDRLGSRLDALGRGPTDLPERQRTLRATVDWSVDLLDEDERRTLATLAVFVDGWTIEAAVEVSGLDEMETLDRLDALAGHSLVQMVTTDDGPRFRMLHVVREYAAELLAGPERHAAERRHATYFAQLVEQADRHLRDAVEEEWADRLQTDNGNLGAAIGWFLDHDITPLPRLLRSSWMYWELREHMVQGRRWVEELLPHLDEFDVQAQVELLTAAATTASEVSDDAAAVAAVDRLGPLLAQVDDPYLKAIAQLTMTWALPVRGDFEGAIREGSEALAQLRAQGETFMAALTARSVGSIELRMGRFEPAEAHLVESDELGQSIGNDWLVVGTRVQLGTLAVQQGRADEARALLHGALRQAEEAGLDTRSAVACLVALADLAHLDGDLDRAARGLGAAAGLRQRAGLRMYAAEQGAEVELVDRVRQALGREPFEKAFVQGSELSRRDAVAVMLEPA